MIIHAHLIATAIVFVSMSQSDESACIQTSMTSKNVEMHMKKVSHWRACQYY